MRFLTKRFIGDYEPNTGSLYSRLVRLDGEQVAVHIQDTPGCLQVWAAPAQTRKDRGEGGVENLWGGITEAPSGHPRWPGCASQDSYIVQGHEAMFWADLALRPLSCYPPSRTLLKGCPALCFAKLQSVLCHSRAQLMSLCFLKRKRLGQVPQDAAQPP